MFEGKAEYIFEGILSLVAGGLLTWMILWTTKMGHTLSQHIEEKLEEAIETGEAWRMFLLPFIQILREGIETGALRLALKRR